MLLCNTINIINLIRGVKQTSPNNSLFDNYCSPAECPFIGCYAGDFYLFMYLILNFLIMLKLKDNPVMSPAQKAKQKYERPAFCVITVKTSQPLLQASQVGLEKFSRKKED